MPKDHQKPIDIDAQIKNLEQLNCTINDYEETRTFLNDVSYFRLVKGYCFGLKSKNSNFNDGVSFNQIKGLYLFNAKFRHLLFPEIEKVEINLRCRLANYFSCKYGALGYKESKNFKDKEYHTLFLQEIEREVSRNSRSPIVKNYRNNYIGGDLPFYALIELFSFGMLSKFFKNMKNEDKKEIAKFYGIGYTYLESWFEHLSVVRNICARYGRFYSYNISIKPILYSQYTSKHISNAKIYASLICLKHLLPHNEHWQRFVATIGLLLEQFPCVKPEYLGFPTNGDLWATYLLEDITK